MSEMSAIKNHFNSEAHSYDERIVKLIPYYREMIEALVTMLPFDPEKPINVLDLGCGTGTIAQAVKACFPAARFTLVDISSNMLEIAVNKIGKESVTETLNVDFYHYTTDKKYDAVVSSLALHHMLTDNDKLRFYSRIYDAIEHGGVFVNADVILESSEFLQQAAMKKWIAYMQRACTDEEINTRWLVSYANEDRPAPLQKQITWLESCGFVDVNIAWKYYNFAVYGGCKT